MGTFGCNCDPKGKALPNSEQSDCCGGANGFDAWCAKAGTPSFDKPQCTKNSAGGVPTWNHRDPNVPPSNNDPIYAMGQHNRCVPISIGCNAGVCDNPLTPGPNAGAAARGNHSLWISSVAACRRILNCFLVAGVDIHLAPYILALGMLISKT